MRVCHGDRVPQSAPIKDLSDGGLMCGMRIFGLTSLVMAMAIPVALLGQAQPEPSFVVRLRYMKIDLPRSSSTTCLAVFPNGRLHMEKSSEWPSSNPQVFEDSLPDESFKSLTGLLETKELKELRTTKGQASISQGEVVWAIIPRGETSQNLSFVAMEGSGGQPAKPLPESLGPLIQWFQETSKELSQRKLRPLKDTKSVDCWLGSSIRLLQK